MCFVCREVKLKGMSTLKSSMQQVGVPLKEGKCDKAPLTKNEYVHFLPHTVNLHRYVINMRRESHRLILFVSQENPT